MTIEEAWATGIIEGEGYFFARPNCKSAQIGVRMTDYDVLQRLLNTWGVGKIYEVKGQQVKDNPNWKPAWQWIVSKRKDVRKLLTAMLPLLAERRSYVASNVLDHLDGI